MLEVHYAGCVGANDGLWSCVEAPNDGDVEANIDKQERGFFRIAFNISTNGVEC